MFLTYLHIAAGGLAIFLIGANLAFILHLGENVLSWFQFKLLAVTSLLVYVALSVLIGGPGIGRTTIAAVALLIDTIALYRLWSNVIKQVHGEIAIMRDDYTNHQD